MLQIERFVTRDTSCAISRVKVVVDPRPALGARLQGAGFRGGAIGSSTCAQTWMPSLDQSEGFLPRGGRPDDFFPVSTS